MQVTQETGAHDRPHLESHFAFWDKTRDIIDQLIDLLMNYRQSGHPGGSRSKVPAFVATTLGGVMRWDVRHPEKPFADRFVLGGGHAIPLVYSALAVFNEALRCKWEQTGDRRYLVADAGTRALYWDDLLGFRRHGGLPGHAEMSGKSLFLKFNTGPSGHGAPAAAGQALALKLAGAGGSRVFVFEGEGGLTPGVVHETMNSAWGLALDNLYFVVDWNDFGIDEHPVSASVYGTPADWFGARGWRVFGTEQGEQWAAISSTLWQMVSEPNGERAPSVAWLKTRKGHGYLKYDYASHGAPHKPNSDTFWETKRPFADKYGAQFTNFGGPMPNSPEAIKQEFAANLRAVMQVLLADQPLVDYLAGRLMELGDSVPDEVPGYRLRSPAAARQKNPYDDPRLYDFANYPADLYVKPGTSVANRSALAKWGAWANAFGATEYGRPLFIAASADLAESTNISGFGKPYGDFAGYGWYERFGSAEGVLLPQEITELANSGILAGLATVNFSQRPQEEFEGLWGACSTYGSFSYLKYGLMRLFSQLTQDCPWKTGKLLYVAAHSGPETAEDSRTHFGIFSPGVTQLFPKGQIINIHPWEYNEVPVLLAAALGQPAPLVALHLTRPPITIPDRAALGIPSHFDAARGAYVVRELRRGEPRCGTVIVQGTSAMVSMTRILRRLDEERLNIKVVYAASPELFAIQPAAYRESVIGPADLADSTVITTQARSLMRDWLFNSLSEEYALSSDWDNRWRTGGTVEEVIDEARLSPEWVLRGIRRFVGERPQRLARLQAQLDGARA